MNIDLLLANPDNIPMLPDTAIRLQELLSSDNSTISDIADVVAIDPTLTSKLLKLANSAFYSFPATIDSVNKAVQVIGSEAVYNLALANSAVDTFSGIGINCIDLDRFWRQSVDTGLIAKELSNLLGMANSERLFVCGLLSNLGELICADQVPEKAKEASTDNLNDTSLPWIKQKAVFGFSYAELTCELMKIWQLPVALGDLVGNIYDPDNSQNPKEAHVLRIAVIMAIGLGDDDRLDTENLIGKEELAYINANEGTLQKAIDFSNLEALNILSILSPQSMSIF